MKGFIRGAQERRRDTSGKLITGFDRIRIKFNKYNCSKNEALRVRHVPRVPDNYFSIHFLSPQPRYSRGIRYIQLTLYRTSTCGSAVFRAAVERKSNSFPGHHVFYTRENVYEVNMRLRSLMILIRPVHTNPSAGLSIFAAA